MVTEEIRQLELKTGVKLPELKRLLLRIADAADTDTDTDTDTGTDTGTDTSTDTDTEIDGLLTELAVPYHLKGFPYLVEGVKICSERGLLPMTKELYPQIAKKFGTTPSRVERAMRHAIEVAFDRAPIETIQSYFGQSVNPLKGKPTNREFIACVCHFIKR